MKIIFIRPSLFNARSRDAMEPLVFAILAQLTPDDVEIEASKDDMGIFLRIWVNKDDMGMIIGRGGVNANAIKLVTKLCGFRNELKVSVKIEEPKNNEPKREKI